MKIPLNVKFLQLPLRLKRLYNTISVTQASYKIIFVVITLYGQDKKRKLQIFSIITRKINALNLIKKNKFYKLKKISNYFNVLSFEKKTI